MHILVRCLLAAVSLWVAVNADARIVDLPVKVVGDKAYHYYEVKPKETIYSLCINLGITKERLIELNPAVADGLKAGMTLLFPATEAAPVAQVQSATPASSAPIVESAAERPSMHLVAKGETLYSIAKRYGLSVPELQQWNSQALVSGLRPGMMLRLGEPRTAPQTQPVRRDTVQYYVVKEKETFYSIAHAHGLSVAELEKANPDVGLLHPGDTLTIPAHTSVEVQDMPVAAADNRVETGQPNVQAGIHKGTVDISLVLPLMLNSENRPVQALRYTEFYKGFLLALDSLRNIGTSVNVRVFDTEDSDFKVSQLVQGSALDGTQLIIAPDNESHLGKLAEYGKAHDVEILNLFAIRNDSYQTNPAMMQANIPHSRMYDRAIDALVRDMRERTPVIVRRKDGETDKLEFVNALCARLKQEGIDYMTVEYDNALTVDDLPVVDAGSDSAAFGFIPISSKQAELNRLLPALIAYKASLPGFESVRLYGYPEWTAFRGETMANMHAANTFVYSRFFTVPDDPGAESIDDKYRYWYGADMTPGVPRQGLLGFDTGMFVIGALSENGGDFDLPTHPYVGVQNGFDFVRDAPESGLVNETLYFVNFRPSGLIDRINL